MCVLTAILVNAVLARRQTGVSDPVLTVRELADESKRPTLAERCDAEAAVIKLSVKEDVRGRAR